VATPIPANRPSSTGRALTAYSVSPDLPAGLSLASDTGIITGTPTAVSAKASYTVTAFNATGTAAATLTITVNAAAAGVQFIPNLDQRITPLCYKEQPAVWFGEMGVKSRCEIRTGRHAAGPRSPKKAT
jgi:hypothetical protein